MRKFAYVYQNTLRTKDAKKEDFYEGERVVNKTDDIKFEDDSGNKDYDSKCYITNFRVLTVSDKYIYDVPLCYVKSHYVKKPFMMGSNYIYIEFLTGINYQMTLPTYIQENFSPEELVNFKYQLPKHVMIKFRGKEGNIDQTYNLFKLALNGKEWNNSYKKITNDQQNQQVNQFTSNTTTTSKISGLGLERTKNIIMNQLNEQNQMISGSFSDIQSLKTNAQQMIDLSQQIKSKLGNLTNDPAMNEINQVLTKIGFVDPVTKETSGKSYFIDLAKQISSFFADYLKSSEIGIISLIDAYCIYNRSRGMSTISPGDMKLALDQLSKSNIGDSGIVVKVFKNDMVMIHTNEFSLESILEKLKLYLTDKECVTLKDFTEVTKTKNQLLSKIIIDEMVDKGKLLVDESDLELRYFLNKIIQYKL